MSNEKKNERHERKGQKRIWRKNQKQVGKNKDDNKKQSRQEEKSKKKSRCKKKGEKRRGISKMAAMNDEKVVHEWSKLAHRGSLLLLLAGVN